MILIILMYLNILTPNEIESTLARSLSKYPIVRIMRLKLLKLVKNYIFVPLPTQAICATLGHNFSHT